MQVVIQPSKSKTKKMDAIIDGKKTVHFGQKGASDFTLHQDPKRKQLYLNRHQKHEDWTKSGINTAGFYSKHILWNKKSIEASVDDLNKRYKSINFILRK
jgi:hypothetical protein